MSQGIVEQVTQGVAQPILIDGNCRQPVRDVEDQVHAFVLRSRPDVFRRYTQERLRRLYLDGQLARSLFQAGQVQQIVHHGQESFAVVPSVQNQFELLGG